MDLMYNHGIDTRSLDIHTDFSEDLYNEIKAVQIYGIYPFSFKSAIETMKKDGKRIIYDFDDAMELVDPSSPFYNAVQRDKGTAKAMFDLSDHITVATPTLKEYASRFTSAPISVIPNCYVESEWKYPRPKREGIRIGFVGSATHVEDLIPVLPTIRKLQKSHNIKFYIMGFAKTDFDLWVRQYKALAEEAGKQAVDNFVKELQEIQFQWIPFVDFEHYPSTLINLSLDIGLCPLKDTPFNRCRSSSKAMEYTLSGALALASNLPTYSQDPTSVLVDNWEDVLTYYVTHLDKIEPKRQEHLEWLQKNRNIENQLVLLKDIYMV